MSRRDQRSRRKRPTQAALSDEDDHDEANVASLAAVNAPPSDHDDGDDGEDVRRWRDDGSDEGEADGTLAALPVLTHAGRWKTLKLQRQDASATKDEGAGEQADDGGAREAFGEEEEETLLETPLRLEQAKEELGTLAIAITEDPQENLGKMKEMMRFTDQSKFGPDVVQLALISTLAVIKDTLPGYYIRPLSEAERNATVSKDIKQIRTFDESILSNYRRFFELLKGIVHPKKQRKRSKRHLPILHIALYCLQEMMLFAGHFNYFEDILRLVAYSLTLPWEGEVERSCQAFRRLFETDESGQTTMLAVRLLSNMIKERNYECPAVWLSALETVRIRAEQASRSRKNLKREIKKPKKHMSSREQKEWKEKQEELARLAEAEGIVSREELNKWNAETLKFLFRIYFGVLKHNPAPDLLPPVLAGLARHAHRIGVEYFTDLLQALRRLMEAGMRDGASRRLEPEPEPESELDLVPALHCILTVDRIYAVNENLAAMDLKFFYNSLFRQLGRLARSPQTHDWDAVQRPLQSCLSNLFHPKRHLPALRVASFGQRLADLAQSFVGVGMMGPAVFAVENLRDILTHHERARAVLDREPFGQGAYLPACDDPDLCNPFSRSLYDILVAVRMREQQPRGKLRTLIDEVLKMAPAQ